MQPVKQTHSNRLIMIGFLVFGLTIGIAFAYTFIALDSAGAFGGGSWKQLRSPLKFEHISAATTLNIWAQTKENKIYEQTYCLSDQGCNQWTETEKVIIDPIRADDTVVINKDTCTSSGIKYPRDPSGNIVECALATRYFNETRDIIYYALLSDGTIWVWRSGGPWYVSLDMYITLLSPFTGLVFGLFIYRSFLKYQQFSIKANV